MVAGSAMAKEVAALLERHREAIADRWAERVQSLPDSHYQERPVGELRASTMRGLRAIIEALTTESYTALENYLTDVSLTRLRMGFDIAEVIEALLLFEVSALPIIWQTYAPDSPQRREAHELIASCSRWMAGRFGALYAGEGNRILRREQRRTALMLDAARAASGSLDLEEVLRRVARGIAEAVGVRNCGIYLLDPEKGLLMPTEGRAAPEIMGPEFSASFLGRPLDPRRDAFTREVLEAGRPVVCLDAESDPRTDKELVRLLGLKSILAVPFVVKERVLGVAMVSTFDEPYAFSQEQIELAWGIANAVALAIENARLYQTEQDRHAEAERRRRVAEGLREILAILNSQRSPEEILDCVVAQAGGMLDADAVSVYQARPEEGVLQLRASHGLEEELVVPRIPLGKGAGGRAVVEGRPVAVPDSLETIPERGTEPLSPERRDLLQRVARRYRAMLAVPLIVQGEVYGALTLRYRSRREFSPEDVALAKSFGDQVALALENARLHQEEQERRQELQTLLDVAAAASSSLELDEMLQATLDRLVVLVGASRAGVMLRDDSTGELVPYMVRPPRPISPQDMAELIGACQGVIASGQPLYILDREHPEPGVLLPLRSHGEVLGVLVIVGPAGKAFSEVQRALFEAIADQVGVAVEKARLYANAEEAAAAAERSRLARELHDAVTQTLFSASLIAEVLPRLWERDREEGLRRLEELRELTRGALAEMRSLLHELRPTSLTEVPLPDLLRQLAEAARARARLSVEVSVEGECAFPPDVQVALYRIAQEALNNVAKHAAARQVTICLQCALSGEVVLEVRDDGIGFDPGEVSPDHLGLGIMRERAESVGAQFTVNSQAGRGTTVSVRWRPREG